MLRLRWLNMIRMLLLLPCSLVVGARAAIAPLRLDLGSSWSLVLLGDAVLPGWRSLAMHELFAAMRLQVRRLVSIVSLHQHGSHLQVENKVDQRFYQPT